MVIFKNVKKAGDFGACADRDLGDVLGVLKSGYRAEYVKDSDVVSALIKKSVDDIDIVDVFAISCADIQYELSMLTDDDAEYRRLRGIIFEKCRCALLIWGDGEPGEAFLRNPVGGNVRIKKEDFNYEIQI